MRLRLILALTSTWTPQSCELGQDSRRQAQGFPPANIALKLSSGARLKTACSFLTVEDKERRVAAQAFESIVRLYRPRRDTGVRTNIKKGTGDEDGRNALIAPSLFHTRWSTPCVLLLASQAVIPPTWPWLRPWIALSGLGIGLSIYSRQGALRMQG